MCGQGSCHPVVLLRERANGVDQPERGGVDGPTGALTGRRRRNLNSEFGAGPAAPRRPTPGYAPCGLKGLWRAADRFAIKKRRDFGLRREHGSHWRPSASRASREEAVPELIVDGALQGASPAAARALGQRAPRLWFNTLAVEHG
jgi:hypothetical protein